ncbi:MAG TPA: SpoIIE family protein phosphatase [Terriglobales bacterium]|nr:SpoIIE family protein phosphatase [Terriglobales bacterium]
MRSRWRQLRRFLHKHGLEPTSLLARIALYLLGIVLFLILFQWIAVKLRGPGSGSVDGWITVLGYTSFFLWLYVGMRWFRTRLMWAVRNRLIVTYVFIGVIPVALLIGMGLLITYLFVGQFATYVATSDLQTEIRRIDAVNQRLASEIATSLRKGKPITPDILQNASAREEAFPNRMVTAWYKDNVYVLASALERPSRQKPVPVPIPKSIDKGISSLSLDESGLSLRSARQLDVGGENLTVISSVPLDTELMAKVAERIGVISLEPFSRTQANGQGTPRQGLRISSGSNEILDLDQQAGNRSRAIQSAAPLTPPKNRFDREVTFLSTVSALEWDSANQATVLMVVRTRPSLMYERLFRTVGQFVNAVLYVLAAVAIFFGIIELIALIIGVRLTRTITASVYKLYRATQHVNRGDFSHRIHVTTNDQLASLETSFNSMTENIRRLLIEQKEKQRLENELSIAQEVQAQLFPKGVFDVESLELYGFCEPARSVSGDYYDFVPLGPDHLALAVGDISGKGISAALLMATIHSAVRAYSLERVPMMATAGVGHGGSYSLSRIEQEGAAEISPSLLCTMLNRQVYRSTPLEKYATIFLGIYDGKSQKLTYCNAGHLPPLILSEDGSLRRLDQGGSVIGLLEGLTFEEAEVTLRPGEIFIAYSDGLSEPENEFGEFGEERLIQLVRENQHLPLQRISDLVVAAVKDWIGGVEQPDDITLVLARLR